MKTLTTEEILSLISLTLIRGEEILDEDLIELYNHCHGEGGKFCSAPGGTVSGRATVRDSDGEVPNKVDLNSVKRGKLGGSLADPHVGTQTFDGIKGYDKTGKPVPGTDAYLEAHNIPRLAFESRPYVKYEASKTDPALLTAYPKDEYPKGNKLFTGTAEDTDPIQSGGYIMYKTPVPGSPHGKIAPQVRPNASVVTDKGKRAKALTVLENSKQRLETLKKTSPATLVKERQVEVKRAKLDLERTTAATPESIKAETRKNLEIAKAKRDDIIANTDDPYEKKSAQLEYNREKREHDKIIGTKSKPGKADHPTYKDGLIEDKTLKLRSAENRLKYALEDPKGALDKEIQRWGGKDGTGIKTKTNSGGIVGSNQKTYEETAAKYLFTPGVTSARIDVGNDPQNIKNLNSKKGRIYFAMEGSIKHDAIQAAIKKEDPTAAVVNVPSVTLWQQKDLAPEFPSEVGWFTKKYGKNKEIVLIPDADGVKNTNVMLQAKALRSALLQNGAKQVYVATPPLKPGTTRIVDEFKLPSGKAEERKGIDDHLGAGRGSLGQLRYETFTEYPDYDLTWATVGGGAKGTAKMSAGAKPRTEKILHAISGLVEDKGIGVIPLKTLNQVAGFKKSQKTSARSSMQILERLGVIKVEWVFDNKAAGRGRRVLNPDMTEERRDELVRTHVIKEPHIYKEHTDINIDLSPVISILKPEYIIKADKKHVGALSELPSWKPPPSYKGWTSAVTGKRDTTGIAKEQEENLVKFVRKNAAKRVKTSIHTKPVGGQTSDEILAAKKAPAGKKLIRTEAGAKRYGASIGQPVPQLSITSTVLLSSLVTEEEVIEFYNKCHGEGGKFCGGSGSSKGETRGSGGSVSGKFGSHDHVRTIAKTTFGSVEVDGIKAKAVYEIGTKDGQEIRLYDKAGNAGKYKDELLGTEAKMHNLYPLNPPRSIVVTHPGKDSVIDENTFAIVHGNSPNIYINSEKLGLDVGKFNDGFQMPSAKTGHTDNMEYLMMHEYGHQVDFSQHSTGGYSYQTHPMYHNPAFQESLSTYGKSDSRGIEAYAETFAEWNYSKGRTKNPAAIAMARYEGWPGANELMGSGVITLTLQNSIHLASQVSTFPNDTEDDINADVPKKNGNKGIVVIDSLTDPRIEGDFKVTGSSNAEIARADKILREVYLELGLKYPRGATNV